MQQKGTTMKEKTAGAESAAEVAANLVGANLLQAVVDELERIEAWRKLDAFAQNVAINTLREAVARELRRALAVVFSGEHPACVATLGAVNFGSEISARLKIEKSAHHRHELADATGQRVLVVIAEPDAYLEAMESVRARAKQGDLFVREACTESGRQSGVAVVADGEPYELLGETTDDLGDVATGEPFDDLVAALRRAGIDVTFNDTARWSAVDRAQARAWADGQNMPLDGCTVPAQPPACIVPLLASRR
jgi:hypothetical protein